MSHQSYSLEEKELICNLLQKGHSVKDISEQLSIPIANIYRWNSKFKNGKSLISNHFPGRKRLLSQEEEEKLVLEIENNPELSNIDLAAVVDNKIAPSTVSDYLRKQNPLIVSKTPSDEEPIDDNKALAEGKKILNKLRRIRNSIRIYQDESYVYDNERPLRV